MINDLGIWKGANEGSDIGISGFVGNGKNCYKIKMSRRS
jgi:hypothetical protein